MILIISTENDQSTIDVIKWLVYFKVAYVRINYEEAYKIICFHLSNDNFCFKIASKDKEIDLTKIRAIWYRRGLLNLELEYISNSVLLCDEINTHLVNESKCLQELFYDYIDDIPHIGTFRRHRINKLTALYKASRMGISIPSTLVSSSGEDVFKFFKESEIVTKSMDENFRPEINGVYFTTYTELVSVNPSDKFFYSKFQEKIPKDYEIRSFYLLGDFYSMAIFSQAFEESSIDFRKTSGELNLPSCPIQLPREIEGKLSRLMNELGLQTASIDMAYTPIGEYVFFEANPIGQFGMTSVPCNYHLEKIMAEKLINLQYGEIANR